MWGTHFRVELKEVGRSLCFPPIPRRNGWGTRCRGLAVGGSAVHFLAGGVASRSAAADKSEFAIGPTFPQSARKSGTADSPTG